MYIYKKIPYSAYPYTTYNTYETCVCVCLLNKSSLKSSLWLRASRQQFNNTHLIITHVPLYTSEFSCHSVWLLLRANFHSNNAVKSELHHDVVICTSMYVFHLYNTPLSMYINVFALGNSETTTLFLSLYSIHICYWMRTYQLIASNWDFSKYTTHDAYMKEYWLPTTRSHHFLYVLVIHCVWISFNILTSHKCNMYILVLCVYICYLTLCMYICCLFEQCYRTWTLHVHTQLFFV